ncbi:TonB-dependent receptor plug domain-containing protein [Vibrio sp. MA40-2]|uniref:TonB-dependent receptor plug domain-containing protein n=1 Tax=Vibrio sp. MA40-2 TaxID=3391828 RepID=UPI0039A490E6
MHKINYITLSILAGVYSSTLVAETQNIETTELGEVEVWSEPFAQKMGTQKVNSEEIEKLPTSNGTISELLKSNPTVRFSSNSSVSESQGEIAPENVSIHGEAFYNNAWIIDGMSNNDNTNPGSNNGSLSSLDGQHPYSLPDGGTQSFWVSSELVDSVDVYDSNISAKYGQFTGGVIDAKLKDPDPYKASGSVSYRITKDEWTKFHFDTLEREESFDQAANIYDQPQFTKQKYSLISNQPLSDSAAILFSYERTDSVIPFHHVKMTPDLWEDQERIAETYMLKGFYEAESGDIWKITAMYSPHESRYASSNVRNGGYSNHGGGYRANLDWQHFFDVGSVTSYAGYRDTTNELEYDAADSYTWALTPSIDWSSSATDAIEGGYGKASTERKIWTVKQDYELDQMSVFSLDHRVSFGWKSELAQASYSRDNSTTIYTSSTTLAPAICFDGDNTCIAGEQAAISSAEFLASSVTVGNDHHAIYVQDQIQVGQWEFVPGMRVDYDEYLGNFDVAPRFTVSYDLFNNKKTILFGGASRYYSDSMLSYALAEQKGSATYYKRTNYDEGWVFNGDRTIGGTYNTADTKTPYSDELNIGVTQLVANSEWTLKWVHREGKNQFTRDLDTDDSNRKIYTLTNDGAKKTDSITLSGKLIQPIELEPVLLDIKVGANYIKSESSYTSYDPGWDSAAISESRYYADGRLMEYDELISRNDFNLPWTLFTTLVLDVPDWGASWVQTYSFTSAFSQYSDTGTDYVCDVGNSSCNEYVGNANIYEKTSYGSNLLADWRFLYRIPISDNSLELNMDILNVFNSKIEGSSISTSEADISYKPGRQFWFGGKFSW